MQAAFHVMPQNGHWRIARVGQLFHGPYPTREEAVETARLFATLTAPCRVLVHDESGDVETDQYYDRLPPQSSTRP